MFFKKKPKLWDETHEEYNKNVIDVNPYFNRRLSQNIDTKIRLYEDYIINDNNTWFIGELADMLSFTKANVLRANMNYVITDVDGIMYSQTKDVLQSAGYHTELLDVSKIDYKSILTYQKSKQAIFVTYTPNQQELLEGFYSNLAYHIKDYAQQETPLMLVPVIPLPSCLCHNFNLVQCNAHMILYASGLRDIRKQYPGKLDDTTAFASIFIITGQHDEYTMSWISRKFQDVREFWALQETPKKRQNNIHYECPIDRPPPQKSKLVMLPSPQNDECYILVGFNKPMRDKKLV